MTGAEEAVLVVPFPLPLPFSGPDFGSPTLHSPGPSMSQKQEEENLLEETGEEKQVKWRGCGGRVGGGVMGREAVSHQCRIGRHGLGLCRGWPRLASCRGEFQQGLLLWLWLVGWVVNQYSTLPDWSVDLLLGLLKLCCSGRI